MKIYHVIILVIGLILCALVYKPVAERVDLLVNGETQAAVIIACDSQRTARTSRTGNRVLRRGWSYEPVALSSQGQTAKGLGLPAKKRCEKLIDRTVQIFVHPSEPEKNRINSYMNFWGVFAVIIFGVGFIGALIFTPKISIWIFIGFFALSVPMGGYELGIWGQSKKHVEKKYVEGTLFSPEDRSRLTLQSCADVAMTKADISDPAQLKTLVCDESGLTDIATIHAYSGLEVLNLSRNDLTDLTPLSSLPHLRKLTISFNKNLTSLKGLERASRLEELHARKTQISDISAIEGLVRATRFDLSYNNITDISAFATLPLIEEVTLSDNPIKDISALANKAALKQIALLNTSVEDISPLYSNKGILGVGLAGSPHIKCDQVKNLLKNLQPEAKIFSPEKCL